MNEIHIFVKKKKKKVCVQRGGGPPPTKDPFLPEHQNIFREEKLWTRGRGTGGGEKPGQEGRAGEYVTVLSKTHRATTPPERRRTK